MEKEQNILKTLVGRLISGNKILADNIVSLYIYGSFITDELTAKSDIDCLVIGREITPVFLSALKSFKSSVEQELGREFFLNISAASDFQPEIMEGGFFTHRERPYYFLFELKYCFRLFYGEDFISSITFPDMMEAKVKSECVRLVKNLQYLNNKLIVNDQTALYSKDTALKNILFASKIIQIFLEYRFTNYKESVALVSRTLNLPTPLLAYELLKGRQEKEQKQGIGIEDSIVFYNSALKMMMDKFSAHQKINGCLSQAGCLAYFSVDQKNCLPDKELDVLIFLNGLPRPAQVADLAAHFSDQGFLFVNLYYPGYWEAPGRLDFSSLGKQVISFGQTLAAGKILDSFSGKEICFKTGRIFLVGSSFGAAVALSAQDNLFSKIVAVSPLLDFPKHSQVIKGLFDKLEFFREVIRLKIDERVGENFLTLDQAKKPLNISADKILIISSQKDKQIDFSAVKKYADDNDIQLIPVASDAHGYKLIKNSNILKQIFNFIK